VGLRAQEAEADDEDVAAGAAGAEVRTGGERCGGAGRRAAPAGALQALFQHTQASLLR